MATSRYEVHINRRARKITYPIGYINHINPILPDFLSAIFADIHCRYHREDIIIPVFRQITSKLLYVTLNLPYVLLGSDLALDLHQIHSNLTVSRLTPCVNFKILILKRSKHSASNSLSSVFLIDGLTMDSV